jgi:hypothetical protein
MKAKSFDRAFDNGENITRHLDLKSATRPDPLLFLHDFLIRHIEKNQNEIFVRRFFAVVPGVPL